MNGRTFFVTLIAAAVCFASAKAEAACAEFDHSHAAFNEILTKHVKDGGVTYDALIKEDKAGLQGYLTTLEACTKADYDGWSREQQMAFLINAYNGYTLRIIIDNYPVKSIRSITFIPGQIFKKKVIQLSVLGKSPISLDTIEHGTLRPKFKDPRVHFAVNCASASCPVLRAEAYVPEKLDDQLNAQGVVFMTDKTKNRLNGDKVELSMIYKWFAEDFKAGGGAPKYASQFAEGDFKTALEGNPSVVFLTYDWSLNKR